jgi:hypothetical protein
VGDANDPASFFETKQGEEKTSVANSKPSATSASCSSSSLDPLYHRPQLTIELFESMMVCDCKQNNKKYSFFSANF